MFGKQVVKFSIDGIEMIGNSDNGSIIGLSDKGKNLVEKIIQGKEINPKLLSEEENILYNTLYKQQYFKESEERGLRVAYVHVNNTCNLHCMGCYSHDSSRNKDKNLSFEEVCLILTKLKKMGAEGIVISGGEPFLRDDIYDIFKFIKEELGFCSLQVITNGTQKYSENIQSIQKYVDEINVSIDGYSAEVPTFIRDEWIYNRVMNSVKFFKDSKVNVKMLATLHRKNIENIKEYLSLSKKMNVPIGFSLLTVAGDFKDFHEWLATGEQLRRLGMGELLEVNKISTEINPDSFVFSCRKSCGVGKRIISIASDGNVYPCHMLHNEKLLLGNILTDSRIVLEKACDEFSDKIDVDHIEKCRECKYRYVCGGGCRAPMINNYNEVKEQADCELSTAYFEKIMDSIKKSIS